MNSANNSSNLVSLTSSDYNDNDNNNNLENKPSKLFKLIWKNKYIKGIIIRYLKIYNIFYYQRRFNSVKSIIEFKYKEYLCNIRISSSGEENFGVLPDNIESLYFFYSYTTPKQVSITPTLNYFIFKNSINIHTLYLDGYNLFLPEIPTNTLPISITSLTLRYYNHRVSKQVLPNHLKILHLDSPKISFDEYSIPNTLTELSNQYFETLPTKKGYIPDGLSSLTLNGTDLVNDSPYFPESLTFLKTNLDNVIIEKLPISLKKLVLSSNTLKEGVFPPNLEYLEIETKKELNSKIIPRYLKSLVLKSDCKTILEADGTVLLPNTLQSLIIGPGFDQVITSNLFSSNLTYLEFDYSRPTTIFNNGGLPLEQNLFPSSLTYLNLGPSFNQPIGSSLSKCINLRELILGFKFSRIITEGSIPFNLELLAIRNNNYAHSIKINNPYTIVHCSNYFNQFISNPHSLIVLKLLDQKNLITLQNYINLEYLDISVTTITNLSNLLPPNNKIKTLILSNYYEVIELKNFQNLENLTITGFKTILKAKITYESNNNSNNSNNSNNNNNNMIKIFNFYSLKMIRVSKKNHLFLDSLDPIFYQFITIMS
ncbi:hypothetical protein DICPUDRAFT_80190 [Dictyostelium purpureum]|uniref:FNIP repeat-containing protein n=1 Tax=Dictyostelium purpureum TaxID=5786 RepID=F0ZPS6_DICPU|nr:uncharacterized protein DICPUDRAFT_80190 [Dictyostelium purpureum]EGC34061.1 hypothetical protein DICPUDRAFT_80190 [Dictyostelium purpureum]|eukprot:XP_003289425.1 hypothetical protein DICPUDRAFT_80190 [Dictyostelium purpureum]